MGLAAASKEAERANQHQFKSLKKRIQPSKMMSFERVFEKVDLKRYKSSKCKTTECKEEADQEELIIRTKTTLLKYLSKQQG